MVIFVARDFHARTQKTNKSARLCHRFLFQSLLCVRVHVQSHFFSLTFHSSFAAVAAAKKKISSVNECWSFVSEHTKVPSHDEWFGLNAELFRGESYWGWGEVYTCLRRPFFISRHSNQLVIFKSKLILRKMHFERRLQSRESLAARERFSNKLHFRLKRVCQQRRVQLNAFRGFVDLVRRVDLEILSGSLAARRGREKQTLVKWRKFQLNTSRKNRQNACQLTQFQNCV